MKKFDTEKVFAILSHPESWKVFTHDNCEGYPLADKSLVNAKQFHAHEGQEIMIALSGNYEYGFNGHLCPCEPGTIFFISDHLEHETFYTGNTELLHLWTYFIPAGIVVRVLKINNTTIDSLLQILVPLNPSINIFELWNDYKTESTHYKKAEKLQLLLLAISFLFSRALHQKQELSNKLQFWVTEELANRIKNELSTGINVERLARIAGYSRRHFIRLFKKYTGLTVPQYLVNCRMQKQHELTEKGFPHKEIAAELGFSDVHSYYNFLRKHR